MSSKEPNGMFNINYTTQNNSYMQLLATLGVFQPLLRDVHQTSTKRFVKPVVIHDFCGAKISLPLALQFPN